MPIRNRETNHLAYHFAKFIVWDIQDIDESFFKTIVPKDSRKLYRPSLKFIKPLFLTRSQPHLLKQEFIHKRAAGRICEQVKIAMFNLDIEELIQGFIENQKGRILKDQREYAIRLYIEKKWEQLKQLEQPRNNVSFDKMQNEQGQKFRKQLADRINRRANLEERYEREEQDDSSLVNQYYRMKGKYKH